MIQKKEKSSFTYLQRVFYGGFINCFVWGFVCVYEYLIAGDEVGLDFSSERDGSSQEKGALNRPKHTILTTVPTNMLNAGSARYQGYISEENKLKLIY